MFLSKAEAEERARQRRGRVAGRVLACCIVAFDVVFLFGALAQPTWWRFAILAVLLAPQLHLALGVWMGQPEDQTTSRSRDCSSAARRSKAPRR